MDIETIRNYCLSLPEAEEYLPFDETTLAFRIMGKIFAMIDLENTEWFAATKRRKTLIEKHKNPGRMPGFKSRKKNDQTFVCFHSNGKHKAVNAIYRKINKNHGVVIIKGQNPSAHEFDGCRWQLKIYVKISQDIRDYTSVHVNWTQKTLVFVNTPLPVSNLKDTDSIVGIDRGCIHMATCDNGTMFDLPKKVLDKCEKEINRRQRRAFAERLHADVHKIFSRRQFRRLGISEKRVLRHRNHRIGQRDFLHRAAVRKRRSADRLHVFTDFYAFQRIAIPERA